MKYLLAYSIPFFGVLGISFQGVWSYTAFYYAFILIPILEYFLPIDASNYSENEKESRLENKLYNVLLYLNVPIVFGCLYFSFALVKTKDLSHFELIGIILSLGIILGSNGINVAHELGHRKQLFERILGKLLLIPSHYTHFFIEHNHGHHIHVSTPKDSSTAKYNQTLYAFWIQTVIGTYREAWKIQNRLNRIENRALFSIKNDMLWFTILQFSYLVIVFLLFGLKVLIVAILSGVVGFLLLETINYIEHYGLKRQLLPSGRFERVSEKHSWNSNHVLGRIILYELTRHSDHHYKSNKQYQILEYHAVSPQLPLGYPASMVISFIPPLWFALMNKRIPHEMK